MAGPTASPPGSPFSAAVITVSDSVHRGEREDQSGPVVRDLLIANGFTVSGGEVVPDDQPAIEHCLVQWCSRVEFVVTTGGTGLAQRDVTPEATLRVCHRVVPGIPELIRAEGLRRTPHAALSRGVCAIRGTSLVLNLPGSPKGAFESLAAALPILPHALELLRGNTEHR